MSNKRFRDAESGEYVSEEYAAANPSTTVSEAVPAGVTADSFLKVLGKHGGAIVSSNDCSTDEIAIARQENRFYVDADSYGYVWVPIEEAEDEKETR